MRMHSLKLFYLHEPDWNGENTLKYLATFGPNTVLSMIAKLREYEADEKASTEEADRIRRACSASGSEMDRE